MQTFLPYPTHRESLQALDSKRLNKQILETYQILKVLSNESPSGAWRNHPAVLMWKGSESELWRYGMTAITLAEYRGIKTDKNYANMKQLLQVAALRWGDADPVWLTDSKILKRMNATHKANLYRKDPEHYYMFRDAVDSEYNKPCCEGCNYYWPTHPLRKS
jgi:hypothetical protein